MHKRALIVEDDRDISHLLTFHLEKLNFDVHKAYSGEEALNWLKLEKPDLILLDLNLPEMDGFEVLANLKHDKETSNIPVIVLTNYSQKEHIDKCFALGKEVPRYFFAAS
jgi:CheY-like chemotaxis protein